MSESKARTKKKSAPTRTAREARAVYGKQKTNGKLLEPIARTKKLIVEMRGGEPYEYYALGQYIVAAPGICGGRPTFKYTRIDTKVVLEMIAGGWSIKRVVDFYQRDEVSRAAIREAILLANEALLKTSTVTAIET